MNTFVKALDNIRDVLTYREANAMHIRDKSNGQKEQDYYRGRADGFRESHMVIQSQFNGDHARPQAQVSIQMAPGRAIIRIGSRVFDIRDSAVILDVIPKLGDVFARCETPSESYCILCDAEATEILSAYGEQEI